MYILVFKCDSFPILNLEDRYLQILKNLKNFIKNIHWLISISSNRYPNFMILLKILKRFYKSSDSKCKIKNRLLKIPKRLRISNSKYRKSKNSIIYFNSKTNCQNFLKKISFLDVPFKRYHRRCFLETRCDTSVFE